MLAMFDNDILVKDDLHVSDMASSQGEYNIFPGHGTVHHTVAEC